jgi:hypothetical protein
MKHATKVLCFLLALSATTLALAGTIEGYSADWVLVKNKQNQLRIKTYVTPTKIRAEFYDEDGKLEGINIVRTDQQKGYQLQVESKTYTEFPVKVKTTAEFFDELIGPESESDVTSFKIERKKVGTETVNGYKTEKIRTTTFSKSTMRQLFVQHIWSAKEFDIPIRVQFENEDIAEQNYIVEMRNIKIGTPAASFFEIPADYTAK